MTEIDGDHPDADRLAAYALGQLAGPEMDVIELHLSSCDSCCRAIQDQPGDSLVWKLRARGASTVTAAAAEGEPTAEPSPGFQIPSSFVIGPATAAALDEQPTVAGPSSDPPAPAGLPTELIEHPRYRVIAAIGAGGMGTVYRAEHRLMDRPVALKVIRADLLGNAALVERFRREVKAAARLAAHPNIVVAYDAEQAGAAHMLVMEFVEGTDLARLVDRRGPLAVGEACEYARQAALGLQHAFEDGMVHRDIKPQNLMRTTRGQIKILDFGLARFASEVGSHTGVTSEGMVLGSADYVAPEQIDDPHAADIRADVYSLGCTLYFLLAGHPPFPEPSLIQKLLAHAQRAPRLLAEVRTGVPPELAQVVERMMAKDPARRFQTPDEVGRALAPFADPQVARTASLDLGGPASLDSSALPAASPSLAAPPGVSHAAQRAHRPLSRLRRTSVPIAAALAILPICALGLAMAVYRIQTDTGELIIETEDPNIEVIVKQGGRQVMIVDPKTYNRIELKAGQYELQLAGGGEGLRLSTDAFTLKRGDKPVVTVRRAETGPASQAKPAPDLRSGTQAEQVGEIARFQGERDVKEGPGGMVMAFLLSDNRHVLYTTSTSVADSDVALRLGDITDPKNPRELVGHGPGQISLALSRDGRLALSASEDTTLRLWDLETGTSRRIRRETVGLGAVAFSPDQRRAAYVCGATIRLCDLETGDELKSFDGPADGSSKVAFSGDGRRIVACRGDIRVWSVETGKEVRRIGDGSWDLAIFPDDRRVLNCSDFSSPVPVLVSDLETGRQNRRIPLNGATSVAVSRDGRRALISVGMTVWLWDLETWEEIERFEGHRGDVTHVAFSPDGLRAVSASTDRTVRVWALPPGRAPGKQPPAAEVDQFLDDAMVFPQFAIVSPDGDRVLATSTATIMNLWDHETPRPAGANVPAPPAAPMTMHLWNRETGRLIRRFAERERAAMSVAFSPDGRRVLSGGLDAVVRLWDLESGNVVRQFQGHTEPIFSVAFAPDGRLAFSTSGGVYDDGQWRDGTDSAVRVWDVPTGHEVRKLQGHKGVVWGVAVSPDGRHVLTCGRDMNVILWDVATGAAIRRFRGHTGSVGCVAFLPDGRRAVSSALDGTIRLWDLENGQEIHRFRGNTGGFAWVAVSPDGRRLLSSDLTGYELRLWDLESRGLVQRLKRGNMNPTRGSFTPDGRHAVWAGADGVIQMYRLPAVDKEQTDGPAVPAQPAAGKSK